jgi:hypothetical protein
MELLTPQQLYATVSLITTISLYCVQGGANQGRHADRHQADDLFPAGQHREDAEQVSNRLQCHKIINK